MKRYASFLAIVALLALTGCASTKQPRGPLSTGVQESGFLKEQYPLMQDGKEGQEMRIYRNPKVDSLAADAYDKVYLDKVTIYCGPQTTKDVPQEQLQILADTFSEKLAENLAKDYLLVNEPGPKTLRIQIALTDAQATATTLKLFSFIPWGIPGVKFAVFKSKELSTGKPVLSGEVTAEAKITDSQTGDVFWAVVDRRVGGRLGGGWKSWTDAENSFQYWAEKVRYALCLQLRHGTDCVAPKE